MPLTSAVLFSNVAVISALPIAITIAPPVLPALLFLNTVLSDMVNEFVLTVL